MKASVIGNRVDMQSKRKARIVIVTNQGTSEDGHEQCDDRSSHLWSTRSGNSGALNHQPKPSDLKRRNGA